MESITRTFVRRPKLALVLALVLAFCGGLCLLRMPIADYPEIAPTMVSVSTTYAGASPQVVADTVATPIENEINAVDNVEYFDSRCNDSGSYSLFVTFKAGTDPDINLVNVQNAVKRAESKLPGEVVQLGTTVKKAQSDYMLRIGFTAAGPGTDLYLLGNFACKEIKEALQRVEGVSQVSSSSSGEYAMRVWLDSPRMDALGLSVFDVRTAISQQNIQPAAGNVGAAFASEFLSYKINVRGRLVTPEEFAAIVVRTDPATGARVLLGDIARCELGVQSYESEPRVDGKPAFFLSIYRDPDANTVATARRCREVLSEWMARLPQGGECTVTLDNTAFTREILGGMARSLALALGLAAVALLCLLGGWRPLLAAVAAIPFTLAGAFVFMRAAGWSFNVFTAFGLAMALGGMAFNALAATDAVRRARDAAAALDGVAGAVGAATLVSLACYLPLAFHGGMVGMMYVQFAATLCSALVLSSGLSFTLLPALAVRLLRPAPLRPPLLARAFRACASCVRRPCLWLVRLLVAHPVPATLAFLALAVLLCLPARWLASGFVPQEDRGIIMIEGELAEGSSIARTREVIARAHELLRDVPGVEVFASAAASSHIGRIGENRAEITLKLAPWRVRAAKGLTLDGISAEVERRLAAIRCAKFTLLYPTSINGLGGYGGVAVFLCALGTPDPIRQAADAEAYAEKLLALPQVKSAVTTFSANSPQLYLSVDRDKAQALGVPANAIFSTLQSKLASFYVNDFNVRGGAYQVIVQNDVSTRGDLDDALDIRFPGANGAMVPLASIGRFEYMLGPRVIPRFNKLPSAGVVITPTEGYSSLDVVDLIEKDPPDPSRYVLNWSTMTYQERSSRGRLGFVVAAALALMYLVLVARYESWALPVAAMLPSAAAVGGGVAGLWLAGLPLSIYAQLGLLLLLEYPVRGAMLTIDRARQARAEGLSLPEAAVEGARRAFGVAASAGIVFMAGLLALMFVPGVGLATRRAFAVPVLSGVLASTVAGLLFAPALYALFQGARETVAGFWRGRKAAG